MNDIEKNVFQAAYSMLNKYYYMGNTEEEWLALVYEVSTICNEYQDCKLCGMLITAVYEYLESKIKE